MTGIPKEIQTSYGALVVQQNVPLHHHDLYKKWLRYYWDFCHKYHFDTKKSESLSAFIEKLRSKRQSEVLCEQARQAALTFCILDKEIIQRYTMGSFHTTSFTYLKKLLWTLMAQANDKKLFLSPVKIHIFLLYRPQLRL